jgi:hypothetical protein
LSKALKGRTVADRACDSPAIHEKEEEVVLIHDDDEAEEEEK